MCLAVPAKVVAIGADRMARIEMGGLTRETDLSLVPEANVGDYVLVHAGYALQKLDEEEAKMTLDLLAEVAALAEAEGERPRRNEEDS